MDYTTDVTLESANSLLAANAFFATYLTTIIVVMLAVTAILIIATWKIFTKAGEEGWKSIIPIYNLYVFGKIAAGNGILGLLLLIPIVNIFVSIYLNHQLSKSFGQGVGFTLGLIFLNSIFTLILGFGSYEYYGPKGEKLEGQA